MQSQEKQAKISRRLTQKHSSDSWQKNILPRHTRASGKPWVEEEEEEKEKLARILKPLTEFL
ncbi:hypothetical protein E2C01_087730 [Portunus trituberculatus]|uniref:Uncharacterized protein n=1 Tax=Portunus trituberculatus TaxID=210409 RepID=A0A5B7J7F3_PORTR|nr:hypothetical protein [Portunus trituberculatus]